MPDRWATDVSEWTVHARRSENGIPRFARRHDALRAARALQRWSSAADELETQQAFDDPLIMARLDAEGRCVTGTVTALDDENKEVKPGNKRASKVPLIEVGLTAPTRLLAGEVVRLTTDRRVKGLLRSVDADLAVLAVTGGVKALNESGLGDGDDVMFVGLDPWEWRDPWAPDEVPWTHKEASTSDLAGDVADDANAVSDDDSPDMSLAELGEIPIVGDVGPDAEPGSIQ